MALKLYLDAHTPKLGVSPVEGHIPTHLPRYAPAPIGELIWVFGVERST
jgi:hypothetical protein